MIETETRFFTYGEDSEHRLELQDGTTLGPITLAYETLGKLNAAKDNAVLLFHALTGSQHFAGYNPSVPGVEHLWNQECRQGWWDGFVGPGKAIDTDKFFVLCVNYLGGCYGTTGPSSINPEIGKEWGGDFPHVSFNDIIDSQIPLFDDLGIEKFHAVVGPSIGGMLAIDMAARYPERMKKVVPVACSIKTTTLTRAHNLEQILAIENDPNFNNGHYYQSAPPVKGLALARMISHKTFVSLQAMEERMSNQCEQEYDEFSWYKINEPLESYLLHQGRKLIKRFDANSYIYLMAAWTRFNLLRDCGASDYSDLFADCKDQEYLLFSIDSDVCFYPEEQEHIHRVLQENGIESRLITVHSEKGHDSFLLEPEKYEEPIKQMLEE